MIMDNLKRTNFTAILINGLIDLFLILGYIVEYLKGGKTLSFVLMIIVVVLIPMIWAIMVYKKKGDCDYIKYITLIGYFILYTIAMFFSSRTLIYVYMFPIVSVYLLYFNLKLIIVSCVAIIGINISRVIFNITVHQLNSPDMTTDYTIQMASVILFSVSLILTTKLSNTFNDTKLKSLQKEQEAQKEVSQNLMRVLNVLKTNTNEITTIIANIGDTSKELSQDLKTFEELSQTTDANIHNQTTMTQNIQEMLEGAQEISNKIEDMATVTSQDIETGNTYIDQLKKSSSELNGNSQTVFKNIEQLDKKAEDIYHITEIITNIADKTNLLSLNASIESARAGEAGKGFGVVANEIRKLATESKTSAENIEHIISQLKTSSKNAVNSSEGFKRLNQTQNDLIARTNQLFESINSKTEKLVQYIAQMHNNLESLLESNKSIVESIRQILENSQLSLEFQQKNKQVSEKNYNYSLKANTLVNEIQNIYRDYENSSSTEADSKLEEQSLKF